jgi:MFS superfamily sulfate permease-like transporter
MLYHRPIMTIADHQPLEQQDPDDGDVLLLDATRGFDEIELSNRNPITRLKRIWRELTLSEISGSLGDLGSLIPAVVALAQQRRIHLASALFFGGVSNIWTGYAWDRPMCVQPMHSIAAVAIAEGLSQRQVSAAGIWMGFFLVGLAVTGLMDAMNKIIPRPVVGGLQLGVGLHLAMKGVEMVAALSWADHVDSKLLGICLTLLAFFWLREDYQRPVGLYLFGIGLVLAVYELARTNALSSLKLFGSPIFVWSLSDMEHKDWLTGLTEGALPQLPLTTLNSVISVCHLSHSLYPNKRHLTRKEVALSVGIMNLFCIPLGGMPNCHGAGGLAGQHRMGARSGASVIFLGVCKVLLGVVLGASALILLDALPKAVLGIMLGIAGLELATTGLMLLIQSGQPGKLRQEIVIAMVTAIVILGMKKAHYGAMSGWMAWVVYGDGVKELREWIFGSSSVPEDIDCVPEEHKDGHYPGLVA